MVEELAPVAEGWLITALVVRIFLCIKLVSCSHE
jgi:hypothetical protein